MSKSLFLVGLISGGGSFLSVGVLYFKPVKWYFTSKRNLVAYKNTAKILYNSVKFSKRGHRRGKKVLSEGFLCWIFGVSLSEFYGIN